MLIRGDKMKLTSEEALELMKQYLDGTGRVEHILKHETAVGTAAGRIAKALGLEEDKAKALGYIHDIGKVFMENIKEDGALVHGIKGYEYIKSLGYDEEYARICILHSYLNNDIDCLAADRTNRKGEAFDFQCDYVKTHEYTLYEKIINLCDLMCTEKILTVEKRMIDLLMRHGVFETTHYHIEETLKLKEYIDNLLGHSVYDLFPEIKANL